jgi:hypothetical protein
MVPAGENTYFRNNYKGEKFIVKAPVSIKEDMWPTS